ncbi:MAG: symmetrical bis(5'-nucleosyl)-tetraphosphatase [Enterobacterales bacterium]
MSIYFIGDVHGCFYELNEALNIINFNPKKDTLWFTGDLIARGPDSLKVINLLYTLRNNIRIVLGNHELNLLSIYYGITDNSSKNKIHDILSSSNAEKLINWLRFQPFLQIDKIKKIIMVHAGIFPTWTINNTIKYANEISHFLKSKNYRLLLYTLYNSESNIWKNNLFGLSKLQFNLNVFTRMRYIYKEYILDMKHKNSPKHTSKSMIPWFLLLNNSIYKKYNIIFGHWSSLMGKNTPSNIYGLDTGCCWGNYLTILHWNSKKIFKIKYNKNSKLTF